MLLDPQSYKKGESAASMSDEEILAVSIKHPRFFEEILNRYQDAFLRKAREVLRSHEEAEDTVQEVFTKIYFNASRFKVHEGASFKSWAYKVLMNTCFTKYQKLKKKNARTAQLSPELEAVLSEKVSFHVDEIERFDYVTSILVRLPLPFRGVMEKYFLEGKSQAEIAEEEGASVGAIKTRMHRAKKEFRNFLSVIG